MKTVIERRIIVHPARIRDRKVVKAFTQALAYARTFNKQYNLIPAPKSETGWIVIDAANEIADVYKRFRKFSCFTIFPTGEIFIAQVVMNEHLA